METIILPKFEPFNPPSLVCHSLFPLQTIRNSVLPCVLQLEFFVEPFLPTSNQCQPLTHTTSIVDVQLVVVDFDTLVCSSPMPIASKITQIKVVESVVDIQN
jgi:hypothetical protein